MWIAESISRWNCRWRDHAWEHWPEQLYLCLWQHQLHYDQQGSLGGGLRGGNVAQSTPNEFESETGNQTWTSFRRPLNVQLQHTPKTGPGQMCDRRWYHAPGFGTSMCGARSIPFLNPWWRSAPADASSRDPTSNPSQRDPGSSILPRRKLQSLKPKIELTW